MKLQTLVYFIHIADEGSFTKAAAKCFVSQPALSKAITELEAELGCLLFERRGRSIELTNTGKVAYKQAKEIMHLCDALKEKVDAENKKNYPVEVGYIIFGYMNFFYKKLEKLGDLELIPISTIAKIVDIVEKEDSFALLPIENSIEGIVRPTIDCLYESDVQIRAQLEIEINHCLYSKGLKEDIKNIISHPQALAQCQKYILENFDENINLINTASTAHAFSELKDKDKTYGAIASCFVDCDDNVKLLEKNIQDYKENKTRFILVSKNKIKIAQNTRTSIVFNTKDESGAFVTDPLLYADEWDRGGALYQVAERVYSA